MLSLIWPAQHRPAPCHRSLLAPPQRFAPAVHLSVSTELCPPQSVQSLGSAVAPCVHTAPLLCCSSRHVHCSTRCETGAPAGQSWPFPQKGCTPSGVDGLLQEPVQLSAPSDRPAASPPGGLPEVLGLHQGLDGASRRPAAALLRNLGWLRLAAGSCPHLCPGVHRCWASFCCSAGCQTWP